MSDRSPSARRGDVLWPTLAAIAGLAVLVSLGAWQLQRMHWKEDLLQRIEARRAEPAVTLEEAGRRFASGEDVSFLTVDLEGRFEPGTERHLYAIRDGAPGWRIIALLETPDGRQVLVDRGFVPEALKSPQARPEAPGEDAVRFMGQVRLPDGQGWFVPDNDPAANQWYWRDLDAMSGDADVPAFFIEATTPTAGDGWPAPQPLEASAIPNRHLQYALTWFALGLALVGVYAAFVRSRLKG